MYCLTQRVWWYVASFTQVIGRRRPPPAKSVLASETSTSFIPPTANTLWWWFSIGWQSETIQTWVGYNQRQQQIERSFIKSKLKCCEVLAKTSRDSQNDTLMRKLSLFSIVLFLDIIPFLLFMVLNKDPNSLVPWRGITISILYSKYRKYDFYLTFLDCTICFCSIRLISCKEPIM